MKWKIMLPWWCPWKWRDSPLWTEKKQRCFQDKRRPFHQTALYDGLFGRHFAPASELRREEIANLRPNSWECLYIHDIRSCLLDRTVREHWSLTGANVFFNLFIAACRERAPGENGYYLIPPSVFSIIVNTRRKKMSPKWSSLNCSPRGASF